MTARTESEQAEALAEKKRKAWRRKEARKRERKAADPEYAAHQRSLQGGRNARWRANNPEAYKSACQLKHRKNYDAKISAERTKAWCDRNPDRVAVYQAKAAIAGALGISTTLVPNEIAEVKVAQLRVLREIRNSLNISETPEA